MRPLLNGTAPVAQSMFSREIQPIQVVTGDGSNHAAENKTDQFQGREQQTNNSPSILKQYLGHVGEPVSQIVKVAP